MAVNGKLIVCIYAYITPSELAAIVFIFVVRVKCSPDDTVGDLKKLIAAQTGTDSRKIQLKKWCETIRLCLLYRTRFNAMACRYTIYKDHITLADYEIHDGMSLEMY